jgi:protein-disulfide isomerase
MAEKSKMNASYGFKGGDRRRTLVVQTALTAIIVVFAVSLVLYIVMSGDKKPSGAQAKPIRVASSKLITKSGSSTDPKVVLSLYEDFLCPVCGRFEQQFGRTVDQLVDTGAIAVDYNVVAILDRPSNQNYSSRAGGAAYCMADESVDAFRRFHSVLYDREPSETGTTFPTNAELIATARQAGGDGKVRDCINSGRYIETALGLGAASHVSATPTVRINGQDYDYSTPDALIAKVKGIVGNVPAVPTAQ